MLSPLSSQTTLASYAFRPYEDRWHGSRFDETAPPVVLPSLMRVIRDLFTRRPR